MESLKKIGIIAAGIALGSVLLVVVWLVITAGIMAATSEEREKLQRQEDEKMARLYQNMQPQRANRIQLQQINKPVYGCISNSDKSRKVCQ